MTFIGDSFEVLGASIARVLGMPDLPYVITPHPIVRLSDQEIVEVANQHVAEVIRAISSDQAQ